MHTHTHTCKFRAYALELLSVFQISEALKWLSQVVWPLIAPDELGGEVGLVGWKKKKEKKKSLLHLEEDVVCDTPRQTVDWHSHHVVTLVAKMKRLSQWRILWNRKCLEVNPSEIFQIRMINWWLSNCHTVPLKRCVQHLMWMLMKRLLSFRLYLCSIYSTLTSSPPFLSEARRPVHGHPVGRHAARHRLGHEVSVRHGLCSPRLGGSKHPGQQQSGVQSVRLRPVPSPGGRPGGCLHHAGELKHRRNPDSRTCRTSTGEHCFLQRWITEDAMLDKT